MFSQTVNTNLDSLSSVLQLLIDAPERRNRWLHPAVDATPRCYTPPASFSHPAAALPHLRPSLPLRSRGRLERARKSRLFSIAGGAPGCGGRDPRYRRHSHPTGTVESADCSAALVDHLFAPFPAHGEPHMTWRLEKPNGAELTICADGVHPSQAQLA
jgi:hypothetical protein